MNLYIITRGRVGNQETLKHIPTGWLSRTYLVCPFTEVDHHHEYHPLVLGCPAKNYSEKFQWMLHLIDRSSGMGVIMDDDLWWDRRPKDGSKRLEQVPDKDHLTQMWHDMENHLDDVPLCGFQPRMMGQNQPLPYRDIGKIITVQGVNTRLFPGAVGMPRVDYDPILADVHLSCYLLSRGYPNRLITDYVVNWKSSQAPGGCDYRTAQMQHDACKRVEAMYPGYATAVTKTPKTVQWLGESRTDLRIQWKKLYKERPNA